MKIFLVGLSLLFSPVAWVSPLDSNFEDWKKELGGIVSRIKVENPKAEFSNLPIKTKGGELDIDYLYIPPEKESRNLIVLNSGIHGVEAPTGVYLQHRILENWMLKNPQGFNRENTGLLVVHVMNPYGAKVGRRYNGDNIDLNRNCFDHQLAGERGFPGLTIQNKEYEELKDFLNSKISTFDIIAKGLFKGRDTIAKSMGGQYHHPRGVNYGGREVASECRSVQNLMKSKIPSYTNVAIFDLHTGLGEKGVHQVMLVSDALPKELATIKKLFPADECEDICEIQESGDQEYLTTGDFTQWVYQRFPQKRTHGVIVSVTSEIGTESAMTVLKRLVNENYCHWHTRDCSEEDRLAEREKLRKVFTLEKDPYWVRQVEKISHQFWGALVRFSKL